MAKLFIVPKIDGLEGLLTLAADPKLMAEHLAKLKEVQDAINERLGDLDTHEKMQDALSRAVASELQAEQTKRRAIEALVKAEADAAAIVAGASTQAEETKRFAEEHSEAWQQKDRELDVLEAAVLAKEAGIIELEAEVSKREQAVAKREVAVLEREDALAAKAKRLAEAVAG